MMPTAVEDLRVGDILASNWLVTSTPFVTDQNGVSFTVLRSSDVYTVSAMLGDTRDLFYSSATDLYVGTL